MSIAGVRGAAVDLARVPAEDPGVGDARIAPEVATKGSIVLPMIKLMRQNRQRALRILPEDLHHYLDERVIVTHWYPGSDHHRLTRVMGELVDNDWELLGRGLALAELTGAYRHVLKSREPVRTLRALPGLWKLNHNTGDLDVQWDAPVATVVVKNWGLALQEHVAIMRAYMLQLLELCDAIAPRVRVTRHEPSPDSLVIVESEFGEPALK